MEYIKDFIKVKQAKEETKRLKWAVCSTIPADTQDDKTEKVSVVAVFDYPILAEDFIEKCLPKETKYRFYIVPIN